MVADCHFHFCQECQCEVECKEEDCECLYMKICPSCNELLRLEDERPCSTIPQAL